MITRAYITLKDHLIVSIASHYYLLSHLLLIDELMFSLIFAFFRWKTTLSYHNLDFSSIFRVRVGNIPVQRDYLNIETIYSKLFLLTGYNIGTKVQTKVQHKNGELT